MRDVPDNVLRDMLQADPELVYLALLKLDHDRLADPIYLVNNNEDVTSSAIDANKVHKAFPFDFVPPGESAEEYSPTASISFPNVDLSLVNLARESTDPPDIWFGLIADSAPNDPVVPSFKLKMISFTANQQTVSAKVQASDLLHYMFPADSFVPYEFPGLHE